MNLPGEPNMTPMLDGRRLLLVEDEMVLALDLSDIVESFGCTAVAVSRVSKALAALTTGAFDAGILDLNLDGEMVYPVADELDRRGVPYIFTTGYGTEGVEAAYRVHTVLAKPYDQRDVFDALVRLLDGRAA